MKVGTRGSFGLMPAVTTTVVVPAVYGMPTAIAATTTTAA